MESSVKEKSKNICNKGKSAEVLLLQSGER